jgi:GDP-D-mannose 3', 5'-epimerase
MRLLGMRENHFGYYFRFGRTRSTMGAGMKSDLIVITGVGGFIGRHLVAEFVRKGFRVRGADIKPLGEWDQVHLQAENFASPLKGDCRDFRICRTLCKDAQEVYQLAADMGGMGFIENNKALYMLSVLTSPPLRRSSIKVGQERETACSRSPVIVPQARVE